MEQAEKEGEAKKREITLEAKEEVHKLRADQEREYRERRNELQRMERRVVQKEEALDRKMELLEKKENELVSREADVQRIKEELEELYRKQLAELERLSGLSSEEAKNILLTNIEKEIRHEAAMMIKEIESQAKEEAEKRAKKHIALAIQRCAADHVTETTVSVVSLPSDEMKGRIIGREGRNIRALETLTGIDLIIDDTPEAVILSGFDPIRREIARIALEKLIVDGRIHPARIEEMVEKATKEVENIIREEGEQATFEAGVHGLHPELVKLLGRLKYRTSYGQNVLQHSLEVAHLCGVMAAEIGADIQLAKRAGLLHDIGKAVDHEVEGPHVKIGEELARRYNEPPEVVHAIAAHHGDIEPIPWRLYWFRQLMLFLLPAQEHGGNPGGLYQTPAKLEEIADSFDGVDKAFAIQAGREIRIMVKPEKIDDLATIRLARDIVKKIERELDYPGQIKVNVIRETRAVEYAK